MKILPAVDILGGKCVRLLKGDFESSTVYSDDPVGVAREWERQGAPMVHVVDLDGARSGVAVNSSMILNIRKAIKIPMEVGGGIRDEETLSQYLNAGIDRVVLGTSAANDKDFLKAMLSKFGAEKIVVAIELLGGKIATEGWQRSARIGFEEYCKELKEFGVSTILFTDISRDGTLTSPNFDAVDKLVRIGFRVIASGGVSDGASISKLAGLGADAAIVGKALYEKRISLSDALNAAQPPNNLAKRIIPCLDVTDGHVVKGITFENLREVGEPVELGKKYAEAGADELVFLDITASKDNRRTLFDVVEKVAKNIFIPFTVGGGLQSIEDIRTALLLGADKVSLNTAAVKNPDLISEGAAAFGEQCIVVAIDVKKKGDKYKVFIKGGSEETDLEAIAWAKECVRRGAGEILLTSMDRDGTKLGYDLDILRAVSEAVTVPIIASGGAGSLEDFKQALTVGKADAALAASLFHYEEFSIEKVKKYLSENKVPVRPMPAH